MLPCPRLRPHAPSQGSGVSRGTPGGPLTQSAWSAFTPDVRCSHREDTSPPHPPGRQHEGRQAAEKCACLSAEMPLRLPSLLAPNPITPLAQVVFWDPSARTRRSGEDRRRERGCLSQDVSVGWGQRRVGSERPGPMPAIPGSQVLGPF